VEKGFAGGGGPSPTPRKRKMPAHAKNQFPPLEVQAVGRRTNDKPRSKPRKGIIEDTGGGIA
jgi:hypothetical protein